jgi:hypothetical protein
MTGFELSVLVAGLAALLVFTWAVDKLCQSLTHTSERIEAKLEKLQLELIRLSDQLHTITESLQNVDKD